ncbi:PTS system, fructose-specific IIA component,PTS-Fru-EIIB, fruA; PTS system, fructose-specific IIB component,PTS-Fru-EIIC, fruA; PTS system, fructose-specific IIC component [uncultured bacterium]|nr:PTS system, fructose-specific IIA component,PTS-Fru-EIIB, fruA; PTS system, fructose-specific IIB component,PTS-Fru-EIIC, fruA; PTS system, fructose-specific IIC component [uncultured bacterium]
MTDSRKQVVLMKGIGVSSGIVIGRAYILERGMVEPSQFCYLDPSETEGEIERFRGALKTSREQLMRIKRKMEQDGKGKEHIRIIDAHLMILKDNMLINDTIKAISGQRVNAEWALKTVLNDIMEYFEKMDDPYLRERAMDIEHIVNRLLLNLMGRKHESIADIKEPVVVVAHDLAPTDTAQMVKGTVLGFLTDVGGKTSHTAIMARSLEIPAVVGLESITRKAESGDTVIVDGTTGTVIINPSESVVEVYKRRRERYENYGKALFHYKDLPSETTDGRRVRLIGNMEIVEEIDALIEHGAEGIGLYRTEFLYLNRKDLPTEEEHVRAYRQVARKMAPNPVVIRTLDVGGDKILSQVESQKEINPALGLRAIRFCLKNIDIFRVQLRGILRASSYGDIKIMFPMISGIEEVRRARQILEECKRELKSEGKAFNPDIEVGVMIEVPSAAMIADLIVKEVSFISIGTNDLLQYSLAIDRVNEHVAYLYEPFHPAVLRIIKTVVEAANKAGVSVSVCGEMAGEPEYALILLGFGVDQLSMNAYSVLRVKRLIRSISHAEAKKICKNILGFATAKEVENYINMKLPGLYKEEFWS